MALPFVGGCIATGFLGSYLGGGFTRQSWYEDNAKPRLWPPQWFFPTVWIGNYILMGLALWQIWLQRQKSNIAGSLVIFALHLLHNFSFFAVIYHFKRRSVYVLMDVIGLFSGLLTNVVFARISRAAGWLMLPYIGWLFFTTGIKVLWWRMQTSTIDQE
ncbi:mitochondrial benzodiazepine receptor/sensory transduction protein [Dictyobacter alpinus]|uniref:Mitochondrial benzodiazepine receptor/sensory transduction protein n=2 Tax=Dictyobacter alpinus TaxID=2014873 RepID=A0A402BAL0_9CHLR|nr:mitochondrial benzodiazepine receptor/sensory transduction protein [Dictyobacter alpinus]